MATVQVNPQESVWYDPDGVNNPVTLQFPLSTDYPNGTEIKLQNTTNSETPVTYLAQGSDTIAQPNDTAVFAASHVVTIPGVVVTYMKFGTTWRVTDFAYPGLGMQCLNVFSFAAYGNLNLSTPPVAAEDIDATWGTIAVFDAGVMPPRGIVTDIASGSMTFQYDGIYRMSVLLNYSHDESNSSRETNLRLYNLTDAVPYSNEILIPISRNQPATLISLSLLLPIAEENEGKEYVLQIGGGDTLTTVIIQAADWSANAISEWRDTLGSSAI